MLGWILFLIGIAGFGYAGYMDLKTTEFPDILPYSLILAALGVRSVFAYLTADYNVLINSIVIGLFFLGFGLALYFLKQWGDGDAWLMGALGFLFPDSSGFLYASEIPFYMGMLLNFFFVSFIYLICYSIVVGIKERAGKKFFSEFKKDMKLFFKLLIVFSSAIIFGSFYLFLYRGIEISYLYPLILSPLILLFSGIFIYYGKFLEKTVFRKKVHVSKLREGDVPINNKWKVLKKEELERIKEKGGYVWIKEGVRFAPVFIITLIITLFYGVLFF